MRPGPAYGQSRMGPSEVMRVRRRHVIYVSGFDARGIPEYYRMFCAGLEGFGALYGVDATVSNCAISPHRSVGSWTTETTGAGWQVSTTYEFYRWEDIARTSVNRALWRVVLEGFLTLARLIFTLALPRYFRWSWRFALLCVYPYLLFALWSALAALVTIGADGALQHYRFGALTMPLAIAAGVTMLVALIDLTERHTSLLYLFSLFGFLDRYSRRAQPEWSERVGAFTDHLLDTVKTIDADEIVLVGHSAGSCVAIDMVARALVRDPELGRHGPRLTILTLGTMLPTVGFYPAAEWFREDLRRVAAEPSIAWVEYQSRKDIISFFACDPLAAHGIEANPARRNPTILHVSFGNLIRPDHYKRFRRHFFKVHFQFILANELPAPYDYFMIVCGPFSLPLRAAQPWDVVTAIGHDPHERDAAWRRLGLDRAGETEPLPAS